MTLSSWLSEVRKGRDKIDGGSRVVGRSFHGSSVARPVASAPPPVVDGAAAAFGRLEEVMAS